MTWNCHCKGYEKSKFTTDQINIISVYAYWVFWIIPMYVWQVKKNVQVVLRYKIYYIGMPYTGMHILLSVGLT